MAYGDLIAYLDLDTIDDSPLRRGSEIPNYALDIDEVVTDPANLSRIIDELRFDTPISLRNVLNNVDGEERSRSIEEEDLETVIFGEFVRLASLHYIIEMQELSDKQLHIIHNKRDSDYIRSLDYDYLIKEYDTGFDMVMDAAESNTTAYLFGRDVCELDDIDIGIRENFYNFTQEVLIQAFEALCESTDRWLYAFETWYETDGHFTGSWRVDHLTLYLKGNSISNLPEHIFRGRNG